MDPTRRERGLLKVRKVMQSWRTIHEADIFNRRSTTSYPDDCNGPEDYYADDGWQAKRMMNNRKICSCWMCGNPRRYFSQKTHKELCADADFRDQLDDYYNNVA